MDTIKKYKISFTQVSNIVLYDKRLSAKAKGIYAYLYSKPDGWAFHTPVILSEIKEGKEAFLNAIKELITYGYITKYQKNIKGCFGGNVYEFIYPLTENPPTVNSAAENQGTNNTDLNNNYLNNIYINNNTARQKKNVDKSVDYGEKVLVGEDFKLNFDDDYFYPYRFANKKLTLSVERWLIKNFSGQEVEKGFICRQIGNFAKKNNCFDELLGMDEGEND